MISGEFTGSTAIPGPMTITSDLFSGLPRAMASTSLGHQPFHDEQHQTILDHYGINNTANISIATSTANVGTDPEIYDEADDQDEQAQELQFDNQFANQFVNQFTTTEEDNANFEDAEDDGDDVYEDDIDDLNGDSNNSNSIGYESTANATNNRELRLRPDGVPFKRKTKGTQTNRKIKPVKRPGLVLKTPIAYQPCIDPSVIPIQRDGMGTFVLFLFFFFRFLFCFRFIRSFCFFLFLYEFLIALAVSFFCSIQQLFFIKLSTFFFLNICLLFYMCVLQLLFSCLKTFSFIVFYFAFGGVVRNNSFFAVIFAFVHRMVLVTKIVENK